jgi:ketosteroid isomerase-like protein
MAVTETSERDRLAAIPISYFRTVDALDVDAVLEHFAEDATLTVQTAGVTFTGHDEIARMFVDFFADWDSMVHDVTNIVVEPGAGKVATEQHVDLVRDGTTKMHNCNFFDVDASGKFSRVIIWMDGTNPLN